MVVLLVSLARRAYHFQQLASSSTPIHECRTYYLKSGLVNAVNQNRIGIEKCQNVINAIINYNNEAKSKSGV
ncbi:hypothetical protein G6Z94_18645 [Vibrio aestuarianus]|nr:hypothetical protein [Vibrio aestuarianus]